MSQPLYGRYYLHPKIIDIANTLKSQFLDNSKIATEISIFLCGGKSRNEKSLRKEVGDRLSSLTSSYKYSVYYPEEMFIELLLGHQRRDLLSLENLLAKSVNVVVILLKSPGTLAELGAFTNFPKLNNKLLVITEPKYKRSKSFINYGPIRYLKTKTQSQVLFISMEESNINSLVRNIANSAREIAKHSSPVRDLTNPIIAYKFYLSLIYIFDPIPKDAFSAISKSLETNKKNFIIDTAVIVINSLINEKKVFLNYGKLSVTPQGIDYLIYEDNTQKRARILSNFLTELRLKALNLTLRKKFYRSYTKRGIWGEAS